MGSEKDINDIRRILRRELPRLRDRYAVDSMGVFGSYLREEQASESDLDVLVGFTEVPGLLKFVELENHLSDLLGMKVDLVMRESLKPRIGKRILREVEPV